MAEYSFREALELAKEVVERFGRTPGALQDVASSLRRLSTLYKDTGRDEEALAAQNEAEGLEKEAESLTR